MRVIAGLGRLLLLPVRLVVAVVGVVLRGGARVAVAPVQLGWRATRRAGAKAVGCFVFGVLLGVLLTPVPGRVLRDRLRRMVIRTSPDPDVRERVVAELAHGPRTWHLRQPEVTVVAGAVTLRGEAPHAVAVEDLVRAATAVPGVVDVTDELVVVEPDPGSPTR